MVGSAASAAAAPAAYGAAKGADFQNIFLKFIKKYSLFPHISFSPCRAAASSPAECPPPGPALPQALAGKGEASQAWGRGKDPNKKMKKKESIFHRATSFFLKIQFFKRWYERIKYFLRWLWPRASFLPAAKPSGPRKVGIVVLLGGTIVCQLTFTYKTFLGVWSKFKGLWLIYIIPISYS